jgi:esterase/lipase superfamily enzyme
LHGYNNSFNDAAFRTAQIVYDLKFDGVAFFYSWPSAARRFKYDKDRESATQAREYLRDFLALISHELGAKKIHLIAHSLGNWPLLEVLGQMRQENIKSGAIFEEIIIAAPDLDRDVFEGLSRRFVGIAKWVTLYGSEKDIALAVSDWKASGGRAGQVTADGEIIVKGVQAIDITELATGIFPFTVHHADFAENPQIIEDMDLLMRYGIHPPDERSPLLEPVSTTGDALYWRYVR